MGKIVIEARRWPWQVRKTVAMLSDPELAKAGEKYGWFVKDPMGRFGAGTNWSLGFEASRISKWGFGVTINLLFGYISIRWRTAYAIEQSKIREK